MHRRRCIVPRSGPDAFLFAALAIIAACLLSFARLSSVLVLLAGAAAEAAVFSTNLGRRVAGQGMRYRGCCSALLPPPRCFVPPLQCCMLA